MGEEHDSDAGPTVSRGNPTGEPKRNQLEIELVGVRGGGPRSKQVSVSVTLVPEAGQVVPHWSYRKSIIDSLCVPTSS